LPLAYFKMFTFAQLPPLTHGELAHDEFNDPQAVALCVRLGWWYCEQV